MPVCNLSASIRELMATPPPTSVRRNFCLVSAMYWDVKPVNVPVAV
jgi:hypothetical protein